MGKGRLCFQERKDIFKRRKGIAVKQSKPFGPEVYRIHIVRTQQRKIQMNIFET